MRVSEPRPFRLMPRARRTTGGFRLYPPGTLDRIRFIRQAQLHGLTLREIHELLGFQDRGGRARCRSVQRLLTQKPADVDGRRQRLQEFQHTLRSYLSQCERALGGGCGRRMSGRPQIVQ